MALGVEGVRVGVWTDDVHATGVTVVLPPPGTVGGAAVRGGAPGSRETAALSPTGSVQECHAIVLCGGSAFGLSAADGVMQWCEEQGVGFVLPTVTVPIVGAAVVFDIREKGQRRPGAFSGRAACEAATLDNPAQGPYGVGAGCTVGKASGRDFAVAAGQGWAIARGGGITVGALMAVNAVGDVFTSSGQILAGSLAAGDVPRFPLASMEEVRGWASPPDQGSTPPAAVDAVDTSRDGAPRDRARVDTAPMNTVIGCIVTDAKLSKPAACRVADLSHGGIVRCVRPAHTSADGDILFVLATGQGAAASTDLVVELASVAVAEAIRAAVRASIDRVGLTADPRRFRA